MALLARIRLPPISQYKQSPRQRMNGLLVYSGGLDSTVLLHHYRKDIKLAVTFDYGSKHNDNERRCAIQNTSALGIEHIQLNLKSVVGKHFTSDLLSSGGDIPDGHYEDESMKRTVVPFRNGIMLSIAAGLAESRGLDTVLIANHFGDHAIYPDCRGEFIEAMSNSMQQGTYARVKIFAPYTGISKREIGLIGRRYGVNFGTTWSCYKGKGIHCGTCGTCVERKEALQGFDPTAYEVN